MKSGVLRLRKANIFMCLMYGTVSYLSSEPYNNLMSVNVPVTFGQY